MSFPRVAWEQVKFKKKKTAQTLSVAQASSAFPRLTQRLSVPRGERGFAVFSDKSLFNKSLIFYQKGPKK